MCGRFALTLTPEEVQAAFALLDVEDFPPRYNIAPTQPILIVINGPGGEAGSNLPRRRAVLVRWGLIPGWAKDPRDMPLLFNARSESAIEKASFRAAMRHRRALVPASGFYEWKREGKNPPQAYWMRARRGVVAFGALMETYAEPGGSEIDTGAILTTAASGDIAGIHDRMPVVIEPENFTRWLDCRGNEPRDVADLMRTPAQGLFEAIPVSDKVNKTANIGPELQSRVEPALAAPSKPSKLSEKPGPDEPGQLKLF